MDVNMPNLQSRLASSHGLRYFGALELEYTIPDALTFNMEIIQSLYYTQLRTLVEF